MNIPSPSSSGPGFYMGSHCTIHAVPWKAHTAIAFFPFKSRAVNFPHSKQKPCLSFFKQKMFYQRLFYGSSNVLINVGQGKVLKYSGGF